VSEIVIRSIGIVSSVGRDARTTCASIRAGISRAAPIHGYQVLSVDDHVNVPMLGHAVPMATAGFSAPARWLQLSRLAFRDLVENSDVEGIGGAAFWTSVVVVCVVPELESGRFLFHPHLESATVRETYVHPLLHALRLPPEHVFVLEEGRVGAFRAIAHAERLLRDHTARHLLILAADSYLDGFSLDWLATLGRLKSDNNPVGLVPGECGVALLLEQEVSDGGRRLVEVKACTIGTEERSTETPGTGRALAEAITECLVRAKLGRAFDGDLFVDLNGETWRAHEFGSAQVHVSRDLLGSVRHQIPAVSVGDTGAATTGLNLALATRALQRGYALGATALVVGSSFDGGVGAAVLQQKA
jgi:3-oxoacyl-[acyl-carrier-protein] synthase-1